jgi:hypothetical protein
MSIHYEHLNLSSYADSYHASRITRTRIRFSFRNMRGRLLYTKLAHTFDTAKFDDG